MDIFLDGHKPPKEIVLATPRRARFFHGYYDSYCYLPLYIFCGRFLLGAKLRPANIARRGRPIVARIRARWRRCGSCCAAIRLRS